MRKIVSQGSPMLNKIRYNYIPVSTYKIQNKPNPIVAVTLGSDNQTLFDLHFRVFTILFSFSKTQFLVRLKISKGYF